MTYYDVAEKYFSPEAKGKFFKLMEGRLREFSTNGILTVFDKFIRDNKIDNYWLENVFVSLFKHHQYLYDSKQIGKIFRSLMILGHEVNILLFRIMIDSMRIFIAEFQSLNLRLFSKFRIWRRYYWK